MEKFEDTFVGYMLRTARMPFFVVASYPHYKIEDGRLVEDRGEESQSLRAEADAGYDLIKLIDKRYKEGKRIPRTWLGKLEKLLILVQILDDMKIAMRDWCDEFYRTVRWMQARFA